MAFTNPSPQKKYKQFFFLIYTAKNGKILFLNILTGFRKRSPLFFQLTAMVAKNSVII